MRRLQAIIQPEEHDDAVAPATPTRLLDHEHKEDHQGKGNTGITVQGIEDVMIRYAQCCNPVPGDNIW